jgi:hypothetical protein
MASNPLGAIRRRLGRAVEWRVHAAVDQRVANVGTQLAADRSFVEAALANHQRAIDDAIAGFDIDRKKFAKVEQDELDSLRTLFRDLSIGIADQQRAQSALLESLDRRVRLLESSIAEGSAPAEG